MFQLFTCFLILLNPTTVFISLSSCLLVLSVIVFAIIYSKRLYLEKEIKRGFRLERMEEEGFISHTDIKNYFHPLQSEIEAKPATIE